MKFGFLSTAIAVGAAAVAIAAAPTAAAAPTGQTCTYVGSETTACQSPGNVQINSDHNVQYPFQYPFYGNALLFHHGGHHR